MIAIGERPLDLADIRAALAGPITVALSDGRARPHHPLGRDGEAAARHGRRDLWRQHRLRQARQDAHRGRKTSTGCRSTSCARMRRASARRSSEGVTRLILLMKLNALAQGASGISLAAMEALAALINADVLPVIPGQGSVGASGDLAPLAHMSLVLIGEGEAMVKGARVSGARGAAGRRRDARGARPQGRAGAAERHAGLDRAGALRASSRRSAMRRPRSSPAPCRSMP